MNTRADAPHIEHTSEAGNAKNTVYVSLAHRMRPRRLQDIVGQHRVVGIFDKQTSLMRGGALEPFLREGTLPSLVLWGPPGTGKTTIARALSQHIHGEFIDISAVFSGTTELKQIFTRAAKTRTEHGTQTVLFVDEIHRFNRTQQDSFLHAVEEGIVTLIGATTENPGFALNNALISRVRVFTLTPLEESDLRILFDRAAEFLPDMPKFTDDARASVIHYADGDARKLLNAVEALAAARNNDAPVREITESYARQAIGEINMRHDKSADAHYNLISALHKSIRGSDADAALYYFARMIEGGDNPRYIARRLLRLAYEDIGLADMQAAHCALGAWQTYERLGSPEGEIALAQVVIYLSLCPKSNSVYEAYATARISAREHGSLTPPAHILNAPNSFMKHMGYGKGYKYDHSETNAFSGQHYFPDAMQRERYYYPVERGFEREMNKRAAYFASLRERIHRSRDEQKQHSKKQSSHEYTNKN